MQMGRFPSELRLRTTHLFARVKSSEQGLTALNPAHHPTARLRGRTRVKVDKAQKISNPARRILKAATLARQKPAAAAAVV